MSINFYTYRYKEEQDFVLYNPWFEFAVLNRIQRELDSDKLKYRIRNEITDQFPSLWRQHMNSESEWGRLRSKLDAHTDAGVSKINNAVDSKCAELLDSKQHFEPLKTSIFNSAMTKYGIFQSGLQTRFDDEEKARNARLVKAEKNIESVQSNQFWTFLGGAAVGIGLGFLGANQSK